jgi:hypothetical protein
MESSQLEFEKQFAAGSLNNDLLAVSNRIEMAVLGLDKLRITVDTLREVIVEQNNKNSKLQQRIFWLTFFSVLLTVTQLVQVVDTIMSWSKQKT